jgi:hypothetical protein
MKKIQITFVALALIACFAFMVFILKAIALNSSLTANLANQHESLEDHVTKARAWFQDDGVWYVNKVFTNQYGVTLVKLCEHAGDTNIMSFGKYAVSTDTAITNGDKVRLVEVGHSRATSVALSDNPPADNQIAIRIK